MIQPPAPSDPLPTANGYGSGAAFSIHGSPPTPNVSTSLKRWAKKYMDEIGKARLDGPVFSNGSRLLTSARVNKTLRKLLGRHVDYSKMQVLGHSFR